MQILEFVDMEHSPKNLLIRATKADIPKGRKEKALLEVRQLMGEYNLSPTLYNLLSKEGYIKE